MRSNRGLYELPMARGRTKPYPKQGIDSKSFEEWSDEAVDKLQSMKHSCALDVAEDGVLDPDEIADALALHRKHVERVYREAILSARHSNKTGK